MKTKLYYSDLTDHQWEITKEEITFQLFVCFSRSIYRSGIGVEGWQRYSENLRGLDGWSCDRAASASPLHELAHAIPS